jgi:hypothetical protein
MTENQERARELRGLLDDMNADVKALARLHDTVTAEQVACLTDATFVASECGRTVMVQHSTRSGSVHLVRQPSASARNL